MQNRIDLQSSEIGAFVTGALDVLFAFSLALECKGLLTRAEIVDALTQVQHQIEAQEGGSTKRTAVASLMLEAFRMPVAGDQARARWRVVDGGLGAAELRSNGLR
jgi:hypothetical protein